MSEIATRSRLRRVTGHPPRLLIAAGAITAVVALIPLALKGVAYRPMDAASLLRRNMLVYGIGGILAPFPCIKLIDLTLAGLHLV